MLQEIVDKVANSQLTEEEVAELAGQIFAMVTITEVTAKRFLDQLSFDDQEDLLDAMESLL